MHVVIDVRVVQCHASVHVVIGVRIVLCCPLVHNSTFLAFYFVPNSHCCHAVIVHPTFTCSHFSHVLHRIPRHLRCGIYTTKIDLRIEGMPQNEILQNEEQMRDISDAIQKFQRNTINLGGNNKEDYVHTKEAADKIYDQGNVELVGTTSNDENHSMPRVPETHH